MIAYFSCVSLHFLKESFKFSNMLQQYVQRTFAAAVCLGTLHAFLPVSSHHSSLNPTSIFPSCGSPLQKTSARRKCQWLTGLVLHSKLNSFPVFSALLNTRASSECPKQFLTIPLWFSLLDLPDVITVHLGLMPARWRLC